MKRLQRSLTGARASSLCLYAKGSTVTIDVGRALTAHVSNVLRCGSPWACPLCAPVVRQQRALEIDAALHRHLDGGGGALFTTLTLRHHRGDTLASRLEPITGSLHHVLKGEPWRRRKEALGYVGSIKAVEVTHGSKNGWHPHSHSLLLFERPPTEIDRCDLSAWMYGRWSSIATKRNLGSITRANGVDVRPVTTEEGLADYLTKIDGHWTPGLELARTDRKTRSPFELLQSILATGESANVTLWSEYERATFGKRAIVWSPGLRALLTGNESEATDEQLAASEGLDLALIRALVPDAVWNQRVRAGTAGHLQTDVERCAAALIFIADRLGYDLPPLDMPTLEGAHLAT